MDLNQHCIIFPPNSPNFPSRFFPTIHYSIYSFKVCLLNFQQVVLKGRREKKSSFFSANHFLCQWQATEGKKFVKGQGCLCFSLQLSVSCINPFLLELIFFNLPLATFARSNQFQSVRKGWSSIYQAFITFLHLWDNSLDSFSRHF